MRGLVIALVWASIAINPSMASAQNDPPLPHDGYQVRMKANPIVFDGVATGREWSEAELLTWGANGVPGVVWGTDGSPEETSWTYHLRMLWDPAPEVGGLYLYGESDHGGAQFLNSSGGVAWGFNVDTVNLYLDPNRDGENSRQGNVDGYNLAFNVSGPSDGVSTTQSILSGAGDGTIGIYYESHVNMIWGSNGGTRFGGNGTGPLEALSAAGVDFNLVTRGTATGWSYELFMPWEMFDGCLGGDSNDGDGLCIAASSGGPGTADIGDIWYFDLAYYINGDYRTHTWGATAGGSRDNGYASWPDPTFILSGTSFQCDLNRDAEIDAADASIMFINWGTSASGDCNGDSIVDTADAGVMFSEWTADPTSAPYSWDSPKVPIPEPSSIYVVLAGLLSGIIDTCQRRQRWPYPVTVPKT